MYRFNLSRLARAAAIVVAIAGLSIPPATASATNNIHALRSAVPQSSRALPVDGFNFKTIFDFKAPGPVQPTAGLVTINSWFYGTTAGGGTLSYGTLYSLSPGGSMRILHNFGGPGDGRAPASTLVYANNLLYGTTPYGGAHGFGTVFSINTAGAEQVLWNFHGGTDGAFPQAGLIFSDGLLYGTTASGGNPNQEGTVFSISPTGQEHVIYRFRGFPDAGRPDASLVKIGSTLYGTTATQGPSGNGAVFAVNAADGKEWIVHSFSGRPDGSGPEAGLISLGNTLYGVTEEGGTNANGTIYAIDQYGRETVLHNFAEADGTAPIAALTALNNTLYGTTNRGGMYDGGTIFSASTTGAFSKLYDLNILSGSAPSSAMLNWNGHLIGTTSYGAGTGCRGVGCGSVFELTF